jgi:hypothetical protein
VKNATDRPESGGGHRKAGDRATRQGVSSSGTQAKEKGMQQAHISALETRHADIDARIVEEEHRPMPDMSTLARLKKEKLKVKEAIEGIH